MTNLPQYYLLDAIGWLTTRWIPFSQSACDALLFIINNNSQYDNYIPFFTGLTIENSNFYSRNFPNDDNFLTLVSTTEISNTLFNTLDFFISNSDFLLDSNTISDIINIITGISEYSSYLIDLEGITPDNSQSYCSVINTLIQLPLFNINAQTIAAD
jgi:hypothetical protein